MERTLRAGVIGVGYLGRFHAQKYALLPGVELVAVADPDPARGRRVADEFSAKLYSNFQDMLPAVELVSVATPTQSHFAIAKACLAAGIHVLLEKPMTVTLDEADGLLAVAEAGQRVLQVGHLKRFHPAVTALLGSGLLDKPRFIESQRLAPFKPRALDVDVVLDLMIHDVDLLLNFVGAPVVAVEAVGMPVVTGQVDVANARLTFENGCIANVTASRVAYETIRRMRLYQEDTYISMDFANREMRVMFRHDGHLVSPERTGSEVASFSLPLRPVDILEEEIRAFCRAVREGTPPLVSGRDGRMALEVISRIQGAIAGFLQPAGVPSS